VAAGFSLDMAVLERAHGVDAVELALTSAAGPGAVATAPAGVPARAAVAVQLRSTLPPGTAGRVTGRLPGSGSASQGRPSGAAEVVAVSGYEPGDRLDGWYDALLATVSAAAPDTAAAARAASDVLSGLPEIGVPHDGDDVRAVLGRLAEGRPVPGT
jgi:biotin carboxylase